MGRDQEQRYLVASIDQLPPGSHVVVKVAGRSIGVVHTAEGNLYALRNICPHHGAPLFAGAITGVMCDSMPHEYEYSAEQTVVRCPWHGYTFRLSDGHSVLQPDKLRVKAYRAAREGDEIVVYV